MKTIIGGAATSIGSWAFAITTTSRVLSEGASLISIFVGIATLVLIGANVKKSTAEARKVENDDAHEAAKFKAWLLSHCANCNDPDNCVFPEHRPPTCKHQTSLEAKKKGDNE